MERDELQTALEAIESGVDDTNEKLIEIRNLIEREFRYIRNEISELKLKVFEM